jgi:hypothetical protein
MNGEQIILPIWHELTKDELLRVAPAGRQGGAALGLGDGRGAGGGDRRRGARCSGLTSTNAGFDRSSA